MVYCKKQLPKGIKQSAVICAITGSVLLVTILTKKHTETSSLRNQLVCMPCLKKELAFNSISSQHFDKIFRDAPIISLSFTKKQSFTENVNKFLQEQSKYLLSCQYYNISEFNMILNHKEKLSLFHLNISSLPYHFQDLNDLLKSFKKNFSVIRITESQLKVNLHH